MLTATESRVFNHYLPHTGDLHHLQDISDIEQELDLLPRSLNEVSYVEPRYRGAVLPPVDSFPSSVLNDEVSHSLSHHYIYPWTRNFPELLNREMDMAMAAAKEQVMKLRDLEFSLHQSQNSVPSRSSIRSLSAVLKPSLQMQNSRNLTTLCEMATYEFLRQPNLHLLISELMQLKGKMYSTRVVDVLVRDPFRLVNNPVVEDKILKMFDQIPQQKSYYRSQSYANSEGICLPSENQHSCSQYLDYRTYSGWCNNLFSPKFGESNIVHRRFLNAEYDDGISSPRTRSVLGPKLPIARRVSTVVHTHELVTDLKYTLLVMQWGQIIDHDLSHTPSERGFNGNVLDCSCSAGNMHPSCLPIPIPNNDPFFTTNCIPFTRSMCGQHRLGPREQANQVTSHLDGSMVYGSDECQMLMLREPNSFLMKTSRHPLGSINDLYKDLPPLSSEGAECISLSGQCFVAGDSRINEHPGLIVMHTVLLREHNRIATSLAAINPSWNVNRVFEEARRILVAVIQHITYNEWLPRVLGASTMKAYKLEPLENAYYKGYDESCSTETFNEFATAAFRFAHSTIRQNLSMVSEEAMVGKMQVRNIFLRDVFNNPDLVLYEENAVDDFLRGLVTTPMENMDIRVTPEVGHHLFEDVRIPRSGMDLFALNIQRGRDHGIPGYNKYREMCGLRRAKSFKELVDEIPSETIRRLMEVYEDPDDVDLFTGLVSETKLKGSMTGPTLACLLGLQFSHLRKCDRFWYETEDPNLRFTPAQLQTIRSSSIAGLLCRNMDTDTLMPRSAFDQIDDLTNPIVRCSKAIKDIDLTLWRES